MELFNQHSQQEVEIKGYVKFFDKKIALTWTVEAEREKYIKEPRKVVVQNGKLVADRRVFDTKVYKEEISFEKPTFS